MGPEKTDVVDPQLRLGVFISRTLWSWPGCLEEIIPCVISYEITLTCSFKMTRQWLQCPLD